jgi:hypothetical protein
VDRTAHFEINGCRYGLRFTFRAFAQIEKELGIKAHEVPMAVNDRGLEVAGAIFGIGLTEWARREKFNLTVPAADLLDELSLQRLGMLIGEGVALGAVENPKAPPAATPAPQGPPGESSSAAPAEPV